LILITEVAYLPGGVNEYKDYFNRLNRLLKLRTRPVAISFLEDDLDELNLSVLRPLRDFKRRFTFCQMVAISRYYGWALGASLDDMSCPGEIIIFGLAKPPEYFLDGRLSYGLYTERKEDGEKLDKSLPRLPYGKYTGIVTSSLEHPPVEPDLVMIYGSPAQMVNLVAGFVYKTGDKVTLSASGKAGSCSGVAEAILSSKPKLILPGLGDRIIGHTEDYEMAFVVPREWLGEIIEGMEKQRETNFIVYPPMPNLFYRAEFKNIPVIGEFYDKFLKELRGE